MKIRAGKKLWRRNPRHAPATIADRIAGSGFPSESARIAYVTPAIPHTPGGEPVQPVEEVDHVHHRDDEDHRERHADPGGEVDDAEEREGEVVDPDAEHAAGSTRRRTGRRASSDGESPRKSSTAPTTVATAAPSRTPRLSPERSRNASDGTRIPRKIASPPRRGIGRRLIRRASGSVDRAEQARHAADRGRQEDDDDERDRSPRRGPPASPAARRTWLADLLRSVQPVACVAEAREDVALLVQAAVDRRDDDGDVGVVAVHARDPLGRRDERDEADRRRACRASPSRRRPRSSSRSRASGRAG